MKLRNILLSGLLLLGAAACSDDDKPVFPQQEEPTYDMTGFAKGGDVSWLTQMEASGVKFYSAEGRDTECMTLLRDLGFNSIRLRVWVNPSDGWCNKNDVLVKAWRAHQLGMRLMIDFHYSDSWADPSQQSTPSAWADMSLEELKVAVADHTKDVLEALKAWGITPEWVQVGNETRNGMMWPSGQLWDNSGDLPNGWENYVALSNAGYDAVKAVFADAKVIVHIDNAYADNAWWFNNFTGKGGKLDMIGLSHYPQSEYAPYSWQEMNTLAATHISEWAAAYGKPVMVSEVGITLGEDEELAAQVLADFMERVSAIAQCEGVFYWEPQCYSGWNGYAMGAFTNDGRPSKALEAFQ